MRRKALIIISFALFTCIYSQQKAYFRGGFDIGYSIPSNGGGVTIAGDFRYNIKDNINIGIRYGLSGLARDINPSYSAIASVNTHTLFISDYYFNKSWSSMFSPFLGGGVGLFNELNVITFGQSSGSSSTMPNPDLTLGGVLHGGFEFGHFRMSLEYYLIPPTNLYNNTSYKKVGTCDNSYWNATFGFYFGGGHWKSSPKDQTK
jgi:hypothetical protein